MLSRATGTRTVVAGFLIYGALFTDRLAPLFLADRIGDAFGVDAAALGLLPLAIAVGWTLGLAAGRLVGTRISLRQRVLVGGMITALGLVQSSTRIAGSFLAPIVLTAVVATAGWQARRREAGLPCTARVAPA